MTHTTCDASSMRGTRTVVTSARASVSSNPATPPSKGGPSSSSSMCVSGKGAEAPYSCLARVQSQVKNLLYDAAAVARIRVCALDVLLALCDYDTAGDARTLRHMNDVLRRQGRSVRAQHDGDISAAALPQTTLFALLRQLCLPDPLLGAETAVVQVAALHLIGHYVVAVYPTVSLAQVSQLCRDVFRHTSLEMAKAACASMLLHVVVALETSCADAMHSLAELDLAELHTLASAMAAYMWPGNATRGQDLPGRGGTGRTVRDAHKARDEDSRAREHAMVISRHGKDILARLQHLFARTLVTEVRVT